MPMSITFILTHPGRLRAELAPWGSQGLFSGAQSDGRTERGRTKDTATRRWV